MFLDAHVTADERDT